MCDSLSFFGKVIINSDVIWKNRESLYIQEHFDIDSIKFKEFQEEDYQSDIKIHELSLAIFRIL